MVAEDVKSGKTGIGIELAGAARPNSKLACAMLGFPGQDRFHDVDGFRGRLGKRPAEALAGGELTGRPARRRVAP